MPLYNLMEDAATAESSRAQVWQWIHHPKGVLEDGRKVTVELFKEILAEELRNIRKEVGESRYDAGKFFLAAELLEKICTTEKFVDFLTLEAYEYV